MISLSQKVTLVTGAGSGIGAAIAECFAEAGARVYVADRDAVAGQATVARILQAGGEARLAELDVTDEAAGQAVIRWVLAENDQRCDVLVNNAGIGHVGTILTTETSDLDRLWRVNLLGAYHLSRAVLPAMIARRAGSIINLASVAGVIGMTRAMAMDHGPTGVRINCICPGRTQTPFVEARLREYPNPDDYRKQMEAPHALKRMARPAEIASAALYLASDASTFVTGSAMTVDGGYTAGK